MMGFNLLVCIFTGTALEIQRRIESLGAWPVQEGEGLFTVAEKAKILICKPRLTNDGMFIL
jgi:hypothetical protein